MRRQAYSTRTSETEHHSLSVFVLTYVVELSVLLHSPMLCRSGDCMLVAVECIN